MRQKRKVTISLTGGLGNQLFQLAAGLSLSKNSRFYLTDVYGNPRVNQSGQPEIFNFKLPGNVNFSEQRRSCIFISKVSGYLLRVGISPKGIEKSRVFTKILEIISFLIFSIYLNEPTRVNFSKNLGFSQVRITSFNTLLFGYFQSYRWPLDPVVRDMLMEISPIGSEEIIEKYKRLAQIEKPLVVHVRLGDYLDQSEFGIPSKEYYSIGIKKLLATGEFSKIWLFSDDLEGAKRLVASIDYVGFRFIESLEYSSAVTLEIMRLGYGYVIANSTFSWWAAFLSRNHNVNVVSPVPWFAKVEEPLDIIPEYWIRVKSIHTINR
jgi:hypothetical protein